MDEIKITPAMIAAGVDALSVVGDVAAEMLVQIIYCAMAEAAEAELEAWNPAGRPN
jgi:hypothetical protein